MKIDEKGDIIHDKDIFSIIDVLIREKKINLHNRVDVIDYMNMKLIEKR